MTALPASLPGLSTREQIQDALYRAIVGLDTDDVSMFDSAFTPDAVFNLNGNVMDGLESIKTNCYNSISKLDTTHFLTNIRIDVQEGATTAAATCSALAQHWKKGEGVKEGAPNMLTGCLYNFDVVKDAQHGLWRIKLWNLKVVWTQGSWAVVA